MARKVLISFLGTGPSDFDKDTQKRQYKVAKYKIDDTFYDTSFISAALVSHLNIDYKIIIGTAKSMWEEYYRYFKEQEDNFDEDLYLGLSDFVSNSNSKTEQFPFKDKIESVFENTTIVILKYGLNDSELECNLLKMLEIENILLNNDEVYVDATHGFRSFPLFAQEIIMYITQVSRKEIVLKKFYYGMLDVIRELGYAPVVDLSIVSRVNHLIVGVNELKNKSDGSALVKLLNDSDPKLANLIDNFSKAFNINYSHEIKKQFENILKYDFEKLSPLEKMIAEKGFLEFKEHFNLSCSNSKFQLDLAKWYFNKKLYGVSYLTLLESIVSFVVEIKYQGEVFNEEYRSKAKSNLSYKKFKDRKLCDLYISVNKIRNNVAHMLDKRHDTFLNDINNLEKRIKDTEKIYLDFKSKN